MSRPAWRPRLLLLAATAAGLAIALGACGDDAQLSGVTNAVPGEDYPASNVCDQLPSATVAEILPGAEVDTSLPSADNCVYAADHGDLIFTVLTPGRGPGHPTFDILYDLALSDATNNGAEDIRPAPALGDDGQVAINADDAEITAVWRRGDSLLGLQYSGWDGRPKDAIAVIERLAGAVQPVS